MDMNMMFWAMSEYLRTYIFNNINLIHESIVFCSFSSDEATAKGESPQIGKKGAECSGDCRPEEVQLSLYHHRHSFSGRKTASIAA